ncbi:ATPase, T2SS/T4P/T4SS family [Alicyclobacillus macrosporangiidus]|uniref:Pilus assembly protein, ATPase of CpaF family n=1 Tax=Alicyclobacillus macrosporangiidus TaxID=392015 RepID=A0A1I7LBF2_9BACL|nr:ATPase, T2SS/T4P/T4SS family [Alicyclobacillus macrosporangiidus]SFV07025.1 Pilus assembly protein, ATPase of CpaF family [Alicyclobacillus macrosporangiidus]
MNNSAWMRYQEPDLLAELRRNNPVELDKRIEQVRTIREHYQSGKNSPEDTASLLERQKEILLEYAYRDLDYLRGNPSEDEMRARLSKAIQQGEVERLPVKARDAIEEVIIQMYHHGILQPLMAKENKDVSDIWVFGTYGVLYQERGENKWLLDARGSRVHFKTADDLRRYVERKLGADFQLDLSAPSVNAIFPDGSRIFYRDKACGFSTWINGEYVLFINQPILVIRRFGHPFTLDELLQTGMFTPRMRDYLALIPQVRDSFLVGGPTGTGKSTLQNAMLAFIPQDELTWVLEDTPDAKVLGGFYGRMWTQEANGEGKGEITIARNLFDLKRMNPQNAIVGEMRDGQAAMRATDVALMTSGLFSSTIHATSPEKMIQVYVNMLMSSGENPKYERALDLFAASFQQLISVELVKTKLPDGAVKAQRLVTTIGEVKDADTGRVRWRPVFERNYRTRKVLFHGLSDRMVDRAYKYGIEIPESLLKPGEEDF